MADGQPLITQNKEDKKKKKKAETDEEKEKEKQMKDNHGKKKNKKVNKGVNKKILHGPGPDIPIYETSLPEKGKKSSNKN
jgi:hypothetical protein